MLHFFLPTDAPMND